MARHCCSVSCPVRSPCPGTSAARERSLEVSCSLDISRENIATVLCSVIAAFRAMFRAMLVLPMPGRAAISTSSDLLRPRMVLSRSGRPVLRPGILLPEAAASESSSKTFCTTADIGISPPTFLP